MWQGEDIYAGKKQRYNNLRKSKNNTSYKLMALNVPDALILQKKNASQVKPKKRILLKQLFFWNYYNPSKTTQIHSAAKLFPIYITNQSAK